jgi:hypothetical protein
VAACAGGLVDPAFLHLDQALAFGLRLQAAAGSLAVTASNAASAMAMRIRGGSAVSGDAPSVDPIDERYADQDRQRRQ